ncbi:bifunctional (p)ppGpp synthetase/guanosine-3',5'-bis(diphosphate) 3'-pyrophosphohydrolase [Flavobacteriales bacterium]|nr:bifunctional (p)ppGpp synthetase/guanosine-3',5'-bis(diphosphate) 3'-pyrophosphohydrolase [Flavobacteriales bacterium]
MSSPAIDLEAEKKEILRRYRGLLRAAVHSKSTKDRKAIRKAFDISLEAHKDMRRKSGEPYIYHPISVARVVAEELGLDTTAIVCALLHDTVEDTYLTLDDVEQLFGPRERNIVDGLTKMSGVFDPGTSAQAENFRKMLLTLSDDVRVILIKLADRLDNMRTLDHMRPDKQQKIASETLFMYAPLAHRLGLYGMKTELEDLSLKYKEPEDFQAIESKLRKGKAVRTRFINAFTLPIRRALDASGLTYEILGRPKSVYSIWMKMQKQRVSFEEVYDVFAIRVIIDSPIEREKADAWRTYSIVSDFYQPNPDRLRDWISLPKANGYESLHTTVMSPSGKWVEVQIRSKRMDEIAEKGLAAHWRYKHDDTSDAARSASDNLNTWLTQIREMLESGEEDALDFIDEFKLNLHSEEIFVFTPNGDLFSLPKGATTLDFAFRVHTQIGSRCIGAKVNHKLVPLSHPLNSGDQVEIITSRKQKPKEDWLKYVITASARSKIRHVLREEERAIASDGKEKLRKWMRRKELEFSSTNIDSLIKRLRHDSPHALLMRIATGELELDRLGGFTVVKGKFVWTRAKKTPAPTLLTPKDAIADPPEKGDVLLIGEGLQKIDYSHATCCNPIPGDPVFGFVMVSGGIKVHRQNCSNATNLLSKYAYRVIKAQWSSRSAEQFEVSLNFTGIDDVGLVNAVTGVISDAMNVNMRAISFNSSDGTFEGRVKVLVTDTDHLKQLQAKLLDVPGVWSVERVDEG